ncbi:ABC-type transport auxiliary lipoprotein family protein [Craterilacuibacter sp. RT1T]|uniref:PqiC family protein n=1 Tax=Craterilacuibacter sp. RT1T TaxID=2942211 RepID=UPI0020C09E29|nr:ABC-type transport auxiliary lipoprotein family protein [Craterilacuibacter sp. RT1T]MCL6262495.1 ABC-type transport auxiliary lipoprotein family protein [Craterilacuibacter sp. RT1T]
MKQRALLLSLLLMLGACASAPKVSYYLLQNPATEATTALHAPLALEVKLPDYLSGPSIVYRESPVQVNLAQYHQWAEAPDKILARQLGSQLAALLPPAAGSPAGKVEIVFDQFNGSYQGYAQLAGRYSYLDEKGKVRLSRPFDIQSPQRGDGYPALVEALSRGTTQLASEIAQQIRLLS